MINVEKLKKERAKLIEEMRTITDTAEAREDKRMTQAEADKWEACDADVKRLGDEIARGERMNALELENADDDPKHQRDGGDTGGTDPPAKDAMGLGEFLRAVRDHATPGATPDSRLFESRAAQGQNTEVPSEGGFLVGEDIMSGIMKQVYDKSLVAGRCRRQSIGANSNSLVWNELDESSRAAGYRNGGVRVYRTQEAGQITKSQATFEQRSMKLSKLAALVYMTSEMLDDTTATDSFVAGLVSDEMSWVVDNEIIRGNGAAEMQGLLNADATVSAAKETAQTAATIVWENILAMRTRMWARSRANAVWYINQDIETELQTMAMVVGTGGVPVYLPAGGASVDGYDRLMGRPVIPIEQCSTVGTVGDIIHADMSQYMIIEKGGMKTASSIHVRFDYDEEVFRFTMRNNGGPGPNWSAAQTPANGTNTVSPFVTLATRA